MQSSNAAHPPALGGVMSHKRSLSSILLDGQTTHCVQAVPVGWIGSSCITLHTHGAAYERSPHAVALVRQLDDFRRSFAPGRADTPVTWPLTYDGASTEVPMRADFKLGANTRYYNVRCTAAGQVR
jgi:hypothetical protein